MGYSARIGGVIMDEIEVNARISELEEQISALPNPAWKSI